MKAVRFDRYGDRDVLYVADVVTPVPAAGEVLVEVRAAGINPGEAAIRSGALHDRYPATFPSGQGSDLAGVVAATGPGVRELAVGDEVLGWTDARASHAELVAVPTRQLTKKPQRLSWHAAGALYVVGSTAHAAVQAVSAQAGDTVAVSGAAGGVGTLVVQLLRRAGVRVLAIASPRNHDWLVDVGAVHIPYGDGVAGRMRASSPEGIDAFIDLYGPEYVELAVEIGVDPSRINTIVAFATAAEVGARTEGSATGSSTEVLAELAGWIAEGSLEFPIAATYPLGEVGAAYAELEERHTHGKVVLVP